MSFGNVIIGILIALFITVTILCWWKLVSAPFAGPTKSRAISRSDGGNSNYRLLVSAQCRPYQDWQCVGVYWSAKKNWPNVRYTRLLSCKEDQRGSYKYTDLLPSFFASDWATHPTTGDQYSPYNRPVSITEYLQVNDPPEEYLVIIDPDTIIRKPLDDLSPQRGKPIAQRYDYLLDKDALKKLGSRFIGTTKGLQPLGMPMIIHKDDLRKLAPLWLKLTEEIRNDPETKELAGWIAEMHSYCLAAAKLGLHHDLRNDLADRTPYDRMRDPYVLHYDLRHDCKDFTWDKRDHLTTDLLVDGQLPVPKSPPNHLFAEVFEVLNEAIAESKKQIKI